MAQRWHLHTNEQIEGFNAEIGRLRLAGKKPTVEFVPERRSLHQNDMIRALYRQISEQDTQHTLIEIIRYCKLHYGVPILRADSSKFAELYDKVIKPHDYETKLEMMDLLPVTSTMSKTQGTEFIDSVIMEYSKKGFSLIHPSELP